MTKRGWLVWVGVVVAATAAPGPVMAQDPDEGFQNLQVLSPELSRAELTAIMRGFSFATGARCSTCHVGEEGQPLNTYDFASDDKAMKLKAREMLRMVASINETLAGLPDRGEPAVVVTCMTCHGGVRRPEPLEAIIERTALDQGADAAVARYRQLREEYYGSRAYDFTELPLVNAGAALAGGEHGDEAKAVLELALEFFPGSGQALLRLGQAEEVRGDTVAALAAYRRVLEMQPGNAFIQRRIQALGGG